MLCPQNAVACIDSKANVCSVQFSPTNSNLMAFGSANFRVYLYDLRNIQVSHSSCTIRSSVLRIGSALRAGHRFVLL